MTNLDDTVAELTAMADRLETMFNGLADARDALPPHHPDKARVRKLAKVAEKGMKALDQQGVTW